MGQACGPGAWAEYSEDADGTIVVRIGGELDIATHQLVEKELFDAIGIAPGQAGAVIVDLNELAFCDSGGVSVFIVAAGKAADVGTQLAVRNVQPRVRRVFEICALDQIITLID